MDYDKLIDAVKLCGSTPKVDQCKQCAYWAGGDMSKCIPKMTADAALAIETLRADLARVTAERDGAIHDLEEIMFKGGHNIDTCHFCTSGQCYGRGGTQACEPKYRGIKED